MAQRLLNKFINFDIFSNIRDRYQCKVIKPHNLILTSYLGSQKTLESPLNCKEIQPVHSEGDQPWNFFGRNDAKAETPVLGHLIRRVDSLEKTLMLGGIGGRRRRDGRGWDGWMASLTRWTWVTVNSGSWWWTGRPGMLRFMGSQRVGHNWVTDLIWSDEITAYLELLLLFSSVSYLSLFGNYCKE